MPRLGHACAAIVLLAACGQAPELIEPKAGAATSARPTADAPTSAPPTMPPLAKRHDEIGAANFVLYWVNVSNYAASTGDTRRLREISAPDCEGCNRYIDLYEKTYGAGGYFRGGDRSLHRISVASESTRFFVTSDVEADAGLNRTDSGSNEIRSEPERIRLRFVAQLEEPHQWVMDDVGLARP
jgi:hypothetical protein